MNHTASKEHNLARQVDAAQSLLTTPAAAEAHRLEQALAQVCRAYAAAVQRTTPAAGAGVLSNQAGVAIFAGSGSPLTQGLAMGLSGPVTREDLDRLEAHLAPTGGGRQVELCPFADPTLPALLAERGYRVHEWQLVWTCSLKAPPLPTRPPDPELRLRRVPTDQPEAIDRYFHAVMAGFLESEQVPAEAIALLRPTAFAAQQELYVACLGDEVIGGASLSWAGGVAFVNGSGVRPAFRRRGAQGALIRARLQRARELGCDIACSSTLPGTASRRNMERHGFSVTYPKLVLLKDG